MRARLVLLYARIHCELREVDPEFLPTGVTALPLLQLPNGKLIDDSVLIMRWACSRLPGLNLWPDVKVRQQAIENLLGIIDGPFAQANALYRQQPSVVHRAGAEIYLAQFEARLARMEFLVGDQESLADLAILPFIHQFAEVDRAWFDTSSYLRLRGWLNNYQSNPYWQQTLSPVSRWRPNAEPTYLGASGPRRAFG